MYITCLYLKIVTRCYFRTTRIVIRLKIKKNYTQLKICPKGVAWTNIIQRVKSILPSKQ